MDSIKLKAPDGVTAVSVEGVEYKVGKDGVATIPATWSDHLYARGWVNAPEQAKGKSNAG